MPINEGFPIDRFPPIRPADRPIDLNDLPAGNQTDIVAELRNIEDDAEELLRRRMPNYAYDPFNINLNWLTKNEQDEIRARYFRVMGGENLLAAGFGPEMMRDYLTADGGLERSPAGRLVFSPEAISKDVRAAFFSQSTVRYFRNRGETAVDNYTLANTLPKVDSLLHNQQVLKSFIEGHGKTLVFDVETPGLNPDEGIWQLSARLMGDDGTFEDKTWYFDNPALKRGLIHTDHGPIPINDFVIPKGAQTDEAANFMEFFRFAEQAQNVAGHNVLFDYRMIANTLKKSQAYNADPNFAAAADRFLTKFADQGAIGNVIDTNVLARMVIPHIGLAPELRNGPNPYPFSLQNIMLRTDLAQKMKAQGIDVSAALSRGMHYADVDVPFESHLLTALIRHITNTETLKIGDNFLSKAERQAIINSSAMGPNIQMMDPNLYSPELGPWDLSGGKLTPMEHMSLLTRNFSLKPTRIPFDRPEDLITRVNAQDRLIGRRGRNIITEAGALNPNVDIPNIQEWYGIQKELASKGVPLPGLSLFERHVHSVLSEISGPGMGETESQLRRLVGSDALGLSRFVAATTPRVVNSNIAVMPVKYLKEWEKSERELTKTAPTNFLQGTQFLGLSPFEWRANEASRPIKEVGAMINLNQEDRGRFLEFLKHHPDFEGNHELLGSLETAFNGNSGMYGLQVGTLGGIGSSSPATNKVFDLLKFYRGIGADMSDQTPMIHMAFAGQDLAGTEGTLYGAGAFLRTDLMQPHEVKSLTSQITNMATNYEKMVSSDRSTATMNALTGAKESLLAQEQMLKWFKVQQTAFKTAPYAFASLVVGGLGYYMHKKHRRHAMSDDTFAQQPAEPDNWYTNNQPYRIPQDYLATANVVSSLDNNKIGHTNMNQGTKYNYLYNTFVNPGYN